LSTGRRDPVLGMGARTRLAALHEELRHCVACPAMNGPPVHGQPVASPVLLVGQAPGAREIELGRPFAWTAGKQLFRWLAQIGLDEEAVRRSVYLSAVCRCFPGKSRGSGDRVPNPDEVSRCAVWLDREIELLRPELILPVGKLAIGRFVRFKRLDEVVGRQLRWEHGGYGADLIPLPHPSGASVWHRVDPGKRLLQDALQRVAGHPAWRSLLPEST